MALRISSIPRRSGHTSSVRPIDRTTKQSARSLQFLEERERFVQKAFWKVRSEPFGSRLCQDGSSERKSPGSAEFDGVQHGANILIISNCSMKCSLVLLC